jgi:hypothetical protein
MYLVIRSQALDREVEPAAVGVLEEQKSALRPSA